MTPIPTDTAHPGSQLAGTLSDPLFTSARICGCQGHGLSAQPEHSLESAADRPLPVARGDLATVSHLQAQGPAARTRAGAGVELPSLLKQGMIPPTLPGYRNPRTFPKNNSLCQAPGKAPTREPRTLL